MGDSRKSIILHVTNEEFHQVSNLNRSTVDLGLWWCVIHGFTVPFWGSKILIPNHKEIITVKIAPRAHTRDIAVSVYWEHNNISQMV